MRQCGILPFVQNGNPACQTAVTAVNNGEVLLGLPAVQLASNLIGDVLTIHFSHQSTQLPHPKLYLHIQKRAQFPDLAASGVGNQRIERVDHR